MKFLVTGHSGFIGRHLCDDLLTAGHQVWGIDWLPQRPHPQHPILVSNNDITKPGAFRTDLNRLLEQRIKLDGVIHLAAQVGRLLGEDDIHHTIQQNALGTAIVAQACADFGIKLTYASTSEIYGDSHEDIVYEDQPWKTPHNLYGLSKRWGEEAIDLYTPDDNPTPLLIRLSMPYGTGAPPGRGRRAMDNFLWHANYGRPVTVHDGATRSWCWVGDTVRAIRLLLEQGHSGAFNVGRDDAEESLLDTAKRACDLAGAPHSIIRLVKPPAAQTVVKRLDTTKLREATGWAPEVDLNEGMPLLYEWIKRFDENGKMVTR